MMVEPTSKSNPKSHVRTVKFCSRCGKPVGMQGVSSLTSWLFQETFCQCQLKESTDPGNLTAPAGSLFGDAPGEKDVFDLPSFGDEYEVLERIGKGGMGCVYKVRDVNLDRFLAVKVLHDELKDDHQSVSRFEREAKAALKLMHANLVPVFAYGSSPAGAPYLVMDFVDGVSLETKLKNEAYLDVPSAIEIFIQICDALTHAHQHGIIHRDLKPGNIIITKESSGKAVAKLVDFGIAKVRSGSSRETQNLTQTGEVFGSPHYMSPEQCLGFDLDSRSDIYSLGCVMYECISGKTPFEGHNAVQLIAKHLSAEEPPLRICDESQGDKVNIRLQEIISKCMEKEPGDRYFSVELLSIDLKHLTEQVSSATKGLLNLPRKLSVLRSLFAILSAASLLSIGFALVPDNMPWLVLLPVSAAIVGAFLINDRLKDFVSRTQFQSKVVRDSASSCVNVLIICNWVLAACAVSALISPTLQLTAAAYPIFSAFLSAVITIVVWAGFLQSVESLDIKNSISTGKAMNVISLALLATVIVFITQSFKPLSSERSESIHRISAGSLYDKGVLIDLDAGKVRSRELSKPIPIGLWDDETQVNISYVEKRDGQLTRVFKIPPGLSLGQFFPFDRGEVGMPVRAVGEVRFPAKEKLSLRLDSDVSERYAPIFSRFADDDISGLIIGSMGRAYVTRKVDDVMYFISHWKKVEQLSIRNADLTDYGLEKIKGFTHLYQLDVSRTRVTAEAICALPQLRSLRLLAVERLKNCSQLIRALQRSKNLALFQGSDSGLTIDDLRELCRFPALKSIGLNYNRGIDNECIKYLSANSKLESLSIVGTKVTPGALPYLAKMRTLRRIGVHTKEWHDSDLELLRKALPKCYIYVDGLQPTP